MQEIDREFFLENRQIGKGVILDGIRKKVDNNISFTSNHPLSSYKGNSFKWNNWNFDDGTQYEGLTLENTPHGKGKFTFGLMGNAGINDVLNNDMYEGEVNSGYAHGIGCLYRPTRYSIYLGEFKYGIMQGCGISFNIRKFIDLLEKGVNYKRAWKLSKPIILRSINAGFFSNNNFHDDTFSTSTEEIKEHCTIPDLKGTLAELKNVLYYTRMFQMKPLCTPKLHKDLKYSLFSIQDPIMYRMDTKFLAPGPAGQLYSLPNDLKLNKELKKIAVNYDYINKQYNILI